MCPPMNREGRNKLVRSLVTMQSIIFTIEARLSISRANISFAFSYYNLDTQFSSNLSQERAFWAVQKLDGKMPEERESLITDVI